MSCSKFLRMPSFAIVMAISLCIFAMVVQLLFYFFNGIAYKTTVQAQLLTENVFLHIGTNEYLLPRGLVLYPLNAEECDPALYEGKEFKIYIDISGISTKPLDAEGLVGTNDYIYSLKVRQ